jgi:hypothetical protein
MKPRLYLPILTLILAALACGEKAPAPTPHFSPTVESTEQPESIFDTDQTAYGFFPSPPEASTESVLGHFQALGDHADFILIQPNIPWEDFMDGVEGDSKSREDLSNQVILAQMNGLECVFVVDPLNGLNRTAFFGLPEGWEPSFGDPNVRQAFTNFTLWIVRELEPRYLGLASEINTYMDAHPADVGNYLSLYAQVYNLVKAEAPETQIFVTFQWDDLNNMFPTAAEGRERYQTNWDQIEAFEPRLDLWVISSYPYFVFHSGEGIPTDYYTPLLDHTAKPLAVAEGGWSTKTVGPISGDPKGQTAYLEAIHDQLGDRLKFWVYIILNDLDMESIGEMMAAQGRSQADVSTLSMFAFVGLRESDGTPKPALALWDLYRNTR